MLCFVFFFVFVLEVFVVFVVSFFFRFGSRSWRRVAFRCGSRSAVASLLWRFRAARRWWRSSSAPALSRVGGACVVRGSLSWLAARWVVVSVLPLCGSGRSRRWVVPAGRFVRRASAFVPARSSLFAVEAALVFG